MTETLAYGTHPRVLNESFPMNTNKIGFRWLSKIFASICTLDESSLSLGRVKAGKVRLAFTKHALKSHLINKKTFFYTANVCCK